MITHFKATKEEAESILARAEPNLSPEPLRSEVNSWNFNPEIHRI